MGAKCCEVMWRFGAFLNLHVREQGLLVRAVVTSVLCCPREELQPELVK